MVDGVRVPASVGFMPTVERRAQEMAHLEEKYAINAAVAQRQVRHETAAIREVGGCGAIAGVKPHERACILPLGHPGAHGWDLVGSSAEPSGESSVVVRLEEAQQGGFQAFVYSLYDGGFVMMGALPNREDGQFYVDSANAALAPFLSAQYRHGLLKAAQECRTVATKMESFVDTQKTYGDMAFYRSKAETAKECASLIEALARTVT